MEKNIEQYLKTEIAKTGGLAFKFVSPGFTGVPDRIILLPGAVIIFVEIKDVGKKLRPRQVQVQKQLEALGFRFEKIDSKQKVKQLIHEIRTA